VNEEEEEDNLTLTSKRGVEGEEEQILEDDTLTKGTRKTSHISNVMCVENLDIFLSSYLNPRRDMVQKGKGRR
jgi:hypothetical protein